MSRCLNLGSQGCGVFLLTMQWTFALIWKEGDSGYLKYKYIGQVVVLQLLLWALKYGEYVSSFTSVHAHYGDTNVKTKKTHNKPHSALAELLLITLLASLSIFTFISRWIVCFTAIAVSCWSHWPCELPSGSVLLPELKVHLVIPHLSHIVVLWNIQTSNLCLGLHLERCWVCGGYIWSH